MATTSEQTARIHRGIAQLQRLSDLFGERRRQLARRVELTEQQWRVLEEIATEHFIPSMFARRRESSAAAVSKVLRQLIDRDLVRTSVASEDRRQRAYELTPRGQATMKALRAHRQRAIEAIWTALPDADLEHFNTVSAELIARVESYARQEKARP